MYWLPHTYILFMNGYYAAAAENMRVITINTIIILISTILCCFAYRYRYVSVLLFYIYTMYSSLVSGVVYVLWLHLCWLALLLPQPPLLLFFYNGIFIKKLIMHATLLVTISATRIPVLSVPFLLFLHYFHRKTPIKIIQNTCIKYRCTVWIDLNIIFLFYISSDQTYIIFSRFSRSYI